MANFLDHKQEMTQLIGKGFGYSRANAISLTHLQQGIDVLRTHPCQKATNASLTYLTDVVVEHMVTDKMSDGFDEVFGKMEAIECFDCHFSANDFMIMKRRVRTVAILSTRLADIMEK